MAETPDTDWLAVPLMTRVLHVQLQVNAEMAAALTEAGAGNPQRLHAMLDLARERMTRRLLVQLGVVDA